MERHVVSIIAFLVSALTLINAQAGQTIVTPSIVGTASVPEGQPIQVSCVVRNMQQWTFLTWQKQTARGPVKIATNVQLESAYTGLQSRYRFSMGISDPATNTVEFKLNITATKFEDSGNYSCMSSAVTANFSIIVVGDPDPPAVSVTDYYQNEAGVRTIENGDTITVMSGSVYDIQYSVSGASPAATVNITSGPWYRQSGAPLYTVTPNVIRTVYPGYDAVTNSVIVLHPKVQFDFFITPRPVTCSAYVTAGNYTGRVYSLTFNVQFADFAPIVNCTPTVYAFVNQPQAYLTCTVTAPISTKPDFWFSFNSNGRNISLRVTDSQQTSPDGTYTADVTLANDVYTMRLLVTKVQQSSFGQYNFTVSNAQGVSTAYTTLQQAQTSSAAPVKPGGGAGSASGKSGVSRIGAAMATILLMAAASLVFFRP